MLSASPSLFSRDHELIGAIYWGKEPLKSSKYTQRDEFSDAHCNATAFLLHACGDIEIANRNLRQRRLKRAGPIPTGTPKYLKPTFKHTDPHNKPLPTSKYSGEGYLTSSYTPSWAESSPRDRRRRCPCGGPKPHKVC